MEVWDAYPDYEPDLAGQRIFGNEYFHLLELQPIDGGYRAYVCDGRYNLFVEKKGETTYQTTEGTFFGTITCSSGGSRCSPTGSCRSVRRSGAGRTATVRTRRTGVARPGELGIRSPGEKPQPR
ncbi:hypothetical protein NIIDNTM18_38050 [Mycolicibacterium litorale]|uniref:Uncharacterized protein n=1 Tax=Mycolicibacterium litorale TaxID=758802 RepID=A0A6S6PAD7_9MYCO|nr:hypothetical protein [Mycolicibacterium litorale]BCI54527.1 hypothetical protein NIIDNTM18_38050 [Mycolicibacterium litorale]